MLAAAYGEAPITSVAVASAMFRVVAGTSLGRVDILTIKNFRYKHTRGLLSTAAERAGMVLRSVASSRQGISICPTPVGGSSCVTRTSPQVNLPLEVCDSPRLDPTVRLRRLHIGKTDR